MKARKKINRDVEVKPSIVVEEPKEEVIPETVKVLTKHKKKRPLFEEIEE